MKTLDCLSMRQVFAVLAILFLSTSKAQYRGLSWDETYQYSWEFTGCSNSTDCDDGNINTTEECLSAHCRIQGDVSPNSLSLAFPSPGGSYVGSWSDGKILTDSSFILYSSQGGYADLAYNNKGSWAYYNLKNTNIGNHYIHSTSDQDGNAYLKILSSTEDTLYKFDGNIISKLHPSNSSIPLGAAINNINFLNNQLWVSTNQGLVLYNGSSWSIFNTSNSALASNDVQNIYTDNNNAVWVTTSAGISVYNGSSFTNINTSNSSMYSNSIVEIKFNSNNDAWILFNDAIQLYDGNTFTSYTSSNSPINVSTALGLTRLEVDQNDQIFVYNRETFSILHFNGTWQEYNAASLSLPGNISTFNIDINNNILIDTWSSLHVFETTNFTEIQDLSFLPNLGYLEIEFYEDMVLLPCSSVVDTQFVHLMKISNEILAANNDTLSYLLNTPLNIAQLNNDITDGSQVVVSLQTSAVNGLVSIASNNEFTYTPNQNFTGIDSFEYEISTGGFFPESSSAWVYLYLPNYPTDSVWPGDANADGIANVYDVLAIGASFGTTDFSRPNATTAWQAQACYDWALTLANSVNAKHADCDGNGSIENADVQVVDDNYGFIHSKAEGEKSANGIPLYLEMDQNTYAAGSIATGNIYFGTIDTPAVDVYGIAFSLNYDNTIIEENSVVLDFSSSWLTGINNVSLAKDLWASSKLDVGHSKTNLMNSSGFGPIASIQFNIQENLAGKTEEEIQKMLILSFSDVLAIDLAFNEIDVNAKTDTLIARQEISGIDDLHSFEAKIFPNPSSGVLNIESEEQIYSLKIISIVGIMVYEEKELNTNSLQLNLESIEQGIYFLELYNQNNQKSTVKFIKN